MNSLRAVRNQRGMSLVTAIFILVVLSAIGGYMVLMAGVQSQTTVMALQGARAYHAARSGLEWGTFQALKSPPSCNPSTILNVGEFTVGLQCQAQGPIPEGGQSYFVYQLTSTAEWGTYGNGDYVSRQLRARVTGATP